MYKKLKASLAPAFMMLIHSPDLTPKASNTLLAKLLILFYRNETKDKFSSTMDTHAEEKIFRSSLVYEPLDLSAEHGKKLYEEILNCTDYDFNALIRYLKFLDSSFDLNEVTSINDIHKCLSKMWSLKSENLELTKEQSWTIAQAFIHSADPSGFLFDEEEKMHIFRKQMVEATKGKLYIAGPTLKDAFTRNSDTASILNDVFRGIKDGSIEELNVYLLNYEELDVKYELAAAEVRTTITTLIEEFRSLQGKIPQLNIFLLDDFSIQFTILNQNSIIMRSTKLFTEKREYKGSFLMANKSYVEYTTQKKYFELLSNNACPIRVSINSHDSLRVAISKLPDRVKPNVKLFKCYSVQLKNIAKRTFDNSRIIRGDENIFLPAIYDHNGQIITDVDFKNKLYNDNSQKVLCDYINITESLLTDVIREHDSNGWAKIIPSYDLGFPNNIIRLAGGFPTGILVDWECSVPIIPIDTTVNTCSSSVFEINGFDETLSSQDFEKIVDKVCKNAGEFSYSFNYKSGNHFLMIAKDDNNKYYLVLHSSARECKESCFGLYPTERSWFNRNIKIKYNNSQTRYLRYIRGETAMRFIDYAERYKAFNKEIHEFVVAEFARIIGGSLEKNSDYNMTKDHYGMPTRSSIAIGTFTAKLNDVIPIFSDVGKDICLFKLSGDNWTYRLGNEDIALVPHGWGQVIEDIKSISICNPCDKNNRKLNLKVNDQYIKYPVISDKRIVADKLHNICKHIRSFNDIDSFVNESQSYMKGIILKKLHPIFLYCNSTYKTRQFKINEDI